MPYLIPYKKLSVWEEVWYELVPNHEWVRSGKQGLNEMRSMPPAVEYYGTVFFIEGKT